MGSPRASPRIAAIFLVKFDVRKGNSIVWSKSDSAFSDDAALLGHNLEFRVMPSGLHSTEDDVIYFVQPYDKAQSHLDGVAVYRQKIFGSDHAVLDRTNMDMYSLGILCGEEPAHDSIASTSVNENKAWVYVDIMKSLLKIFVSSGAHTTHNYTRFEQFFDKYSSAAGLRPNVSDLMPSVHPITAIRQLLVDFGPLVFEVYKSVLLRKRLLLVSEASSHGHLTVELSCQFVHVLSIFGAIPSDISHLLPRHNGTVPRHVNAMYSVSLPDLQWLSSSTVASSSFVATTRDAVLLEKSKIYDLAVHTTDERTSLVVPVEGVQTYKYATSRSKRRFQVLIEALGMHERIHRNSNNTAKFGSGIGGILDNLSSVCSSNTVNGFLWWASAGEQNADEAHQDCEGLPLRSNLCQADAYHDEEYHLLTNEEDRGDGTAAVEPEPLEVTAMGYFHQMTRRLFQATSSIIQTQDYEEAGQATVITLHATDLRRMGLDAYAPQDAEFAVEFIKHWWHRDALVKRSAMYLPCCS